MSGTIDRRGATPPDFLVKLLTMVGDEAPDLISWTGGKLYIHDPVALERKMSVYFRHSNFSSFQRQLNNFGFRKVEGKGKLAPCMYMHDDLVGRHISASRGAAAPSRHRRDSPPSDEAVGGLLVDFEPFRTPSSRRVGESARGRGDGVLMRPRRRGAVVVITRESTLGRWRRRDAVRESTRLVKRCRSTQAARGHSYHTKEAGHFCRLRSRPT